MKRIGILGSDNSHALAFAKIINLPDSSGRMAFPDLRVVGVYGENDVENQKVFAEGRLDFIAEQPADMLGHVDAVIVDFRHGGKHAPAALPYVQAGLPCFVDKPFTVTMADAYALVDAATASGAPLMGGSACKLVPDIAQLAEVMKGQTPGVGEIVSGMMNYPGDTRSEYAGLFFYGPHLVEMGLAVFGQDVQSVRAVENHGQVTAIARYDHYDITWQFTRDNWIGGCALCGVDGNHFCQIDFSASYELEMQAFADMLRTGKSAQTHEQLIKPVAVLSALVAAIEQDREVLISEFER